MKQIGVLKADLAAVEKENTHLTREYNMIEGQCQALEKERDEAIGSNDKEWCQLVESVLGWHPVGQTDFLRIGLSIDYRKLKADLTIAIKAIEKLYVGTDCNYCDANEKVLEEFNAS